MIKWADQLISAVRLDATREHVIKVMVREDLGDSFSDPVIRTKDEVIAALDKGIKFKTIVVQNEEWKKGATVYKEYTGNAYHLKTRRGETDADRLENLPKF